MKHKRGVWIEKQPVKGCFSLSKFVYRSPAIDAHIADLNNFLSHLMEIVQI
jgi:hypothetical protein